jgi:hypothetical protein
MLIRHHTTPSRCDSIGTLKDPLMCINPLGFRMKQGIKLSSRYHVLAKSNSPPEQVYTPSTPPHWPLSGKITTTSRSLIIQSSQSHIALCCTVILGGSPCSNQICGLVINLPLLNIEYNEYSLHIGIRRRFWLWHGLQNTTLTCFL